MDILFDEYAEAAFVEDDLMIRTRTKDSVCRVILKREIEIDGERILVASCARCAWNLSYTKVNYTAGKYYKANTVQANRSRRFNKSAGRSMAIDVGLMMSQHRKELALETKNRRGYIKQELNKAWDAGTIIKGWQWESLIAQNQGKQERHFRVDFIRRYKNHLKSKQHELSLKNELRQELLEARARQATKTQLNLALWGAKLGVSGRAYSRMARMSWEMGVDVGDVGVSSGASNILLRARHLAESIAVQHTVMLREKHPRTDSITAFVNIMDYGTVVKFPIMVQLIMKRIGRNNRIILVDIPNKYSGDEIDESAGYALQGERTVYDLSKKFKLSGSYIDTYCKGSMVDGALALANTFREGMQRGYSNIGVELSVDSQATVRYDVMHKISRNCAHVFEGKESKCVMLCSEEERDITRTLFKTVVKPMLKSLNPRGGKEEMIISRLAASSGMTFTVGKMFSNTRLHPFLAVTMEAAICNFPIIAQTLDEGTELLLTGNLAWMVLLITYGLYSPLASIFYTSQNCDYEAFEIHSGVRRMISALDEVKAARNLDDLRTMKLFKVLDRHYDDLTNEEQPLLQGVMLDGPGTRCWREEKKAMTADLTEDEVLAYARALCRMFFIELTEDFQKMDEKYSCWSKLNLAAEKIGFSQAVILATGERKQCGDGEHTWRYQASMRSNGLEEENIGILMNKGLYRKPEELLEYDSMAIETDVAAFRDQVMKMLSGLSHPKTPARWIRRWFRKRSIDPSSPILRARITELPAKNDEDFALSSLTHIGESSASMDTWHHFNMDILNTKTHVKTNHDVILRTDIMIGDFYDPDIPQQTSAHFLCFMDILDKAGKCIEGPAETAVSAMGRIAGKGRPFDEKSKSTQFTARASLAIAAPGDGECGSLLDFSADMWVDGEPNLGVLPKPVPVIVTQRNKTPDAFMESARSESSHHLHKSRSMKEVVKSTKKIMEEYRKFLDDECRVDIHDTKWKDDYEAERDEDAYDEEQDDEDDDALKPLTDKYVEPSFDYVSANAFYHGRSQRRVYVRGMFAKDGTQLAR